MLGKGAPYDELHWFWSDQYDMNLQYAGFHRQAEEIVIRGSLARREFLAFYLNEGRVDAIAAVNQSKALRRAMRLIKARTPVTRRERLRLQAGDRARRRPAGDGGVVQGEWVALEHGAAVMEHGTWNPGLEA